MNAIKQSRQSLTTQYEELKDKYDKDIKKAYADKEEAVD